LGIPTIGIGAGAGCDGQVLVTHDLLGLFDRFTPKFARKYANLYAEMEQAFTSFRQDVENGVFPGPEHTTGIAGDEWDAFLSEVEKGK
jgi:3-methyl-2-oxobutanoate hydroxymethyltransferase